MIELTGFRFLEELGSNEEINLYRVVRLKDNQSMLLKTMSDKYTGSIISTVFDYEYKQLLSLRGRGVLEPIGLEMIFDKPVLLLQDPGGITLEQAMLKSRDSMKFENVLAVAIAVVDCVRQLHQANVTLNELTPLSFIVHPNLTEVKCVDIRSSSTDKAAHPFSLSARITDAILPYLSPEQTGRTGMVPDYRSDFYSLGVILYEWFARSLPYSSKSAMELVHHHLATTPELIHQRNQSVPRIISDIVSKCMEKMPESRYVSAYGIRSDLEECRIQLRLSGKIQPFTLAKQDISENWIRSEEIVGRHAEQQTLLQSLYRVSEGSTELIWISGDAGTGKTSLVMTTLRQAVPAEGFFVVVKAESTVSTGPQQLWIQVFEQLIDQLLTLNHVQAEMWKLKILDTVQGNGTVITEHFPRLELLIGEQPMIDVLPPIQARKRIHHVLIRFLQLFSGPGKPLILFFDQLQWANEAFYQYLYQLLEGRNTMHLMIVGAYRDKELQSINPLIQAIDQLEQSGAVTKRIHLTAFDRRNLKHILSPITSKQGAGIDQLAEVILQKTDGNPLFVKQFLEDVLDRKLVTFNDEYRAWQWDIQHIAELSIPDQAATLVTHSLTELSGSAFHMLGRAAFLGKSFDNNLLAFITNLSLQQLGNPLEEAVEKRMLQEIDGEPTRYVFQHDSIQHAAYESVAEAERLKLHMEIGFYLAQRRGDGEAVPIFEVVEHLNKAFDLVIAHGKSLELAELNLQAGLEAKQSFAYEASLTYLRLATDLLEDKCWDSNYLLTFHVHKERAELEFLCGQLATANEFFNLIVEKAASDYDKAQVCIRMTQLELNRDSYHEVIALGEMTLKLLGIRHTFDPSSLELAKQWTRMKWKLRKCSIESFGQLPPMTDERYKAAMSVFVYTGNAIFTINKNGWVSWVLTILEITLDYGLNPDASVGFVGYSLLLNYQLHQYEAAYKWGRLACEVSKHKPRLFIDVYSSFSLCHDSWIRYEPDFLVTFADHIDQYSLQSGDSWQANHSTLINGGLLFQFGHPLKDIYTRVLTHFTRFHLEANSLHGKQAAILTQFISTLTGYRALDDPYREIDVESNSFIDSENPELRRLLQELIYVYQYVTGYVLGDYEKAYIALDGIRILLSSSYKLLDISSYYYYMVLVLKERYEAGNKRQKAADMKRIRLCTKELNKLARRNPEMYMHKCLLVKAETASLQHKDRQAEQLYEQALEAARSQGQIHDVGIIAECFAQYRIRRGKLSLGRLYMNEAYEAYLSWGALAKTAEMEKTVGHLLLQKRDTETHLDRIDYLSVVRSVQALSGEMEMEKLLQMLLLIMLQNSGAEYGALIFDYEDQWMVEAYGTAEKLCIESIPLQAAEKLVPTAVIGYTARTKNQLVLHDVASNEMFERNDYIKAKELKSVLCLPIMHQNKLICLLYLENNLSTGIFTEERLDILKLLSSQCAISIANAKLYTGIQLLKSSLEDQVVERTRMLERSMKATSEALAETTVYAERNRIAQEIHDVVGHTLTSTVLQIEAGKRLLHKDVDSAVIRLKEAQDLVRHSLNEIRNSVHMLKEDKYYDLKEAMQLLIQNTERNTGAIIHAEISPVAQLSLIKKKLIYHALQEGLTNGIRHGSSTQFIFSLQDDGAQMQFRLADNGEGASTIEKGFGLKMMEDRVQQLKGNLSIDTEPGKGCLLKINLPHSM